MTLTEQEEKAFWIENFRQNQHKNSVNSISKNKYIKNGNVKKRKKAVCNHRIIEYSEL